MTSTATDSASLIERLRAALENFEVREPDSDGDVWLVFHGNGTSGKGAVNLGNPARLIVPKVALLLEQDRRDALEARVSPAGDEDKPRDQQDEVDRFPNLAPTRPAGDEDVERVAQAHFKRCSEIGDAVITLDSLNDERRGQVLDCFAHALAALAALRPAPK